MSHQLTFLKVGSTFSQTGRHQLIGSSRSVTVYTAPYTQVLEMILSKCLTNWLSGKSDRFSKRRIVTNWSGRHDPSPFIRPPTHWCLRWFFLSVSRTDFLESRIDFLRDGSSPTDRVVTIRHRLYGPLRNWYLSWFFLSVSRTDFLESRIDFLRDGSSPTDRVVTIRHRLYGPLRNWYLSWFFRLSVSRTDFLAGKSDRLSKRRIVNNWSGRHDPSPFIQPPTHWCLRWFF